MARRALRIKVKGVVQGVGFRPFVYQTARRLDLRGEVYNTSGDVTIRVEGTEEALQAFLRELQANPPPRAVIESITSLPEALSDDPDFVISRSRVQADQYQLISPDLATCPDCLREILDPANRRYRYPFTNCTNCGPRFTIIEDIPYDRPLTTMREFEMCPECRQEYEDPRDRRFHAQPNACPRCGPRLQLTSADGTVLPVEDVLQKAAELLREGSILAVKGLGGFLLACDAGNEETVRRLRERKQRPSKPLAVMLADLAAVEERCEVNPAEAAALTSPAAPIVLLRLKAGPRPAPSVAPGLEHLGVMLPYTPLHHLLLRECGRTLVMTSGNLSEEPIACGNEEALARLQRIADYFILHNREIYSRYDDSVISVEAAHTRMLRRARGYAPYPLRLPYSSRPVLACGPELKNTFCLTRDEYAFVSQHIGDLENQESLEHFETTLRLYQRLFRIRPELIACDLHPDYLSTRWAEEESRRLNLPLQRVQHHHAHIAACLAENGAAGPVIGVALDGTGYGTDGRIWGGEFLIADYQGFERRAHLEYLPLPGGSLAIRKPYRSALGYTFSLLGERISLSGLPGLEGLDETEIEMIRTQVKRGLNSPLTSSCGRLFDAVSALLGIRGQVDYEGQAAIELEEAAAGSRTRRAYPYRLEEDRGVNVIKLDVLWAALLEDIRRGAAVGEIAAGFHNSLLSIMMDIVNRLAAESGIRRVALSGGVFQNRRLYTGFLERLEECGLVPLRHRQLPVNDGCVALGQAAVAHFTEVR